MNSLGINPMKAPIKANFPDTPEALLDQIPGYLERRKQDYEALKACLVRSDSKGIGDIAHKIIGNAKSWGFETLGMIAIELKELADKSDLDGIARALNEMKIELEKYN